MAASCYHPRTDDNKVLYNGIILPAEWPPRYSPEQSQYRTVPWLESKPEVIPVDLGRQLFIDDYLIEETDMVTVYHEANYYSDNPVLEPDRNWEITSDGVPYSAPFSDGIWYDEKARKFKMWYLTGGASVGKKFCTAYAESDNGKNWKKPVQDIVPGTSIVDTNERDAATLWLDKQEQDPGKRFKFFNVEKNQDNNSWQFILKYSSDGIHWSKSVAQSGAILDRSSAYFNPFRQVWCLSLRQPIPKSSRSRAYLEAPDPETAVSMAHRIRLEIADKNVVFWFSADSMEQRHPDYPEVNPGIYHFDCIPYESIILGQYSVWQGPDNQKCEELGVQKRNEVMLGYSRDGFHFHRPVHSPFLPVCPQADAWNWGNVQSITGTPLVVGDSLYFYVSGRRLNPFYWDGYSSCGLATLRRDGFASLRASGKTCHLLTETIVFHGKYLFVNAKVEGQLKIDVVSENGSILQDGPSLSNIDSTRLLVMPVQRFAGKRVKLRFSMTNGDIYSFWISPWDSGESQGYTAGGGPGLSPDGIDRPLQ
ncbi:MAG: hypothetical protein IKW89_00365 [Bacteroidales bacterium]|nr:hypothetical protein [Bacteroidales bacterium]